MHALTESEIRALHAALDDEYRAWATYDRVIADFGDVRPFGNIREAEARHIQALHGLFARYGLEVPENPWSGRVERYADLHQACAAGVKAEIENDRMYDRLLGMTDRRDIRTVLENLQAASRQRHLPAFQRCAQRARYGGRGERRRRGGRK